MADLVEQLTPDEAVKVEVDAVPMDVNNVTVSSVSTETTVKRAVVLETGYESST